MIVVDAPFLVLLIDPDTTQPGDRERDRVLHLLRTTVADKGEIIIPAPVITELVAGGALRAGRIAERVATSRYIRTVDLTPSIAIEAGDIQRAWTADARKRHGDALYERDDRVLVKFDALIAATAVRIGASEIVTRDKGMKRFSLGARPMVRLIKELPLPPEDPQLDLLRDAAPKIDDDNKSNG